MEKAKRKIFFWALVALFLIVAPTVALNAWGYRFDFHRGVFVHSGTITLKTNPQNFSVYIDGKLEDSKKLNRINNSYNISGLIPKNYNIRIEAPGFQPWTKTMEVHSGVSTEFWNVLLVKNEYVRTPYAADGAEKFFISPKNDYIAYTRPDDSGVTVKIIEIKNKAISNSFSFPGWKFIDDSREENIEWSPNGNYISIPLKKMTVAAPEKPTLLKIQAQKDNTQPIEIKTEYSYFVGDPNTNNYFNLNELVNKNDLKNVRWDPQDKNYLFFLSGNSFYKANINDKTDITLIADNVSSFDLSKTSIYYAQMPNELVFKTDLDGKSGLVQVTSDFPEKLSSPNEKLIVFDDMRIAFLNTDENLYIFNRGDFDTYFKKLGSNIKGMQFSDDGKKLLFRTNNEISAYFLRQWSVQPVRNEDEIQDITRYSETLKNVQWFKDYEHILFSVGPHVKIIELDSRDHRISMDFLKTANDLPSMTYNGSLDKLFFIDNNDNLSDIYSVVFPEPSAFLGIFLPPTQQ